MIWGSSGLCKNSGTTQCGASAPCPSGYNCQNGTCVPNLAPDSGPPRDAGPDGAPTPDRTGGPDQAKPPADTGRPPDSGPNPKVDTGGNGGMPCPVSEQYTKCDPDGTCYVGCLEPENCAGCSTAADGEERPPYLLSFLVLLGLLGLTLRRRPRPRG